MQTLNVGWMGRRWARGGRLAAAVLGLGLALTAPPPAAAQTPGELVVIADEAQPIPGPGTDPNARPEGQASWSHPPGGSPRLDLGWHFLRLFDIDADGRDDLCGLYGLPGGQYAYGCVINNWQGSFAGRIVQAQAFNGSPNTSIHGTMALVDLDGNGERHLCGRTAEGMKCQHFNRSSRQFDPAVRLLAADPSAEFSDANGWNQEAYHATIGFARMSGRTALCGRGRAGVMCFLRNRGAFNTTPFWAHAFGDGNLWDQPQYFRTLRYVDINGDGHSDVCARGRAGILCSMWQILPSRFLDPVLVSKQYSDAAGWGSEMYYRSIRFADISGDGLADVCGRGTWGLYCGINPSRGGALVPLGGDEMALAQNGMSNGNGWGTPPARLDSIVVVDFDADGRNDVCGLNQPSFRGFPDLYCTHSDSTSTGPRFAPLVLRTTNVAAIDDTVVAGRIHAGGRIGFCWRLADGSVNCSVRWP